MKSPTTHTVRKFGLGVSSNSYFPGSGVHRIPASWYETLGAMAVVLVGLAAFAFVLIVLPWVISI